LDKIREEEWIVSPNGEQMISQRMSFNELEFSTLTNKEYLDQFGFPITINEKSKTIVLYHGTRASFEKIMKEGLLIRAGLVGNDTKMKMIDDVLNGELGVERGQIPDWIWKNEYEYEQTRSPHLHMSLNFGTALGYSHQGCEIKAQIRNNFYSWILSKRYGENLTIQELKIKLGHPEISINGIACEMNGKESHVFQVEVPINFLDKEDYKFWREILEKIKRANKEHPELKAFESLKRNTLEIRILRNIPPEMIKRAWKIYFKDNSGFQYEIEERQKNREDEKK